MPQNFSFAAPDALRLLHLIIVLATFGWSLCYTRCLLPAGNRRSFLFPALATLVATLGIFFASSLFTLFLCFEVMSIASYLLVIYPRTDVARRAGSIYLAVAVIGGLCMLMGLLLIYTTTGTLMLAELPAATTPALWVAGLLLLVGFGAKAGMFPLHVWLPSSYTESPFCGTIILSSALSKAGTFGVILLGCTLFATDARWGALILTLGLATMLVGGLLAVASPGLKSTLAYSSMSQIGFILAGAGMLSLLGEHNAIAARGTVLHVLNHSLIKLVLFTVAAILCKQHGTQELRRLHGAGRGKPLLAVAFMTAGAAVAGVPLLSGYVSKTLLHESMVECIQLAQGVPAVLMRGAESIFLFSGGLTAAYIGKLVYILFLKRTDAATLRETRKVALGWQLAPVLLALPLVVMGLLPHATMDKIADAAQQMINPHLPAHAVEYFARESLVGAGISLAVGMAVAALLLAWYRSGKRCPRLPKGLLDGFYIPAIYRVLPLLLGLLARLLDIACSAPLRAILRLPPRNGKVYPKLNFSFGSYTEQSVSEGYFSKYLPSSLKYSLLTFTAGLLLAVGYLIFFG